MSLRARLGGVLAVASLSFRESARNRVLHALIGTMVFVCGLAYLYAWVAGGDTDPARLHKVVGDLSLSALVLLGTVASIFLGTNLVYQEVQRRTVYTVLARPLSRDGFLLGKYLGLAGVMGVAVAVMGLVFFVAYGLGAGPPTPGLLVAVVFVYVELLVVVAVALFFSVAAHPIEGAVFSFVVALAGHQTSSLLDLGKELLKPERHPGGAARLGNWLLWALYVVLPNLENFNLRGAAVYGMPITLGQVGFGLLYALVYVGLVLVLAGIVFRRRVL
ncbi:MAG: ABC transporter permease [Planctomycetota bacterium]